MNFNQVLNILSEGDDYTEEKESRIKDLIDDISDATDRNQHTKARMILADFIGATDLFDKYEIIDRIHMKKGDLDSDLQDKRNALDDELFKDAKEYFTDVEFKKIMRAY